MGHCTTVLATEGLRQEMITPLNSMMMENGIVVQFRRTLKWKRNASVQNAVSNKCVCNLPCHYFALLETLEEEEEQLPKFRNKSVINHIKKVRPSER